MPKEPPVVDPLLGTDDMRRILGVGKYALERLLHQDASFPAFQVGPFWKIKPRDLDAWMEKQKSKRPA